MNINDKIRDLIKAIKADINNEALAIQLVNAVRKANASLRPDKPNVDIAARLVDPNFQTDSYGNYTCHSYSNALRNCMGDGMRVLVCEYSGSYQGEVHAIVEIDSEYGHVFALWNTYYGSCSCCDALESGANPFPIVKNGFKTTRQFWSLDELGEYVNEHMDFQSTWNPFPAGLVDSAKEKASKLLSSHTKS